MKKLRRRLFLWLSNTLGIPRLHSRLDKQKEVLNAIEASVQAVSASLQHNIRDIHLLIEEKNQLRQQEIAGVRRAIDLMRANETPTSLSYQDQTITEMSKPLINPALYVALEDAFRGDRELVSERQSAYIPYVKDVVTTEYPLIDLGCGRGEWLRALKQLEIPAYGVDSNHASLSDCVAAGVTAHHGDLVQHLASLSDASVGAITMFQVLEHLPFNLLVDVLRQARRVLRDGGIFIGEVPNGETLRVGASTFWIDPTHERPIFPGVLRFLASEVGFSKVDGHYSSPLAPEPDVSGLPEGAAVAIKQLHTLVNGPGDFALIATA